MKEFYFVINETASLKLLLQLIEYLKESHQIQIINIIDDFDEIFVDIKWKSYFLTLDYEAIEGISIYLTPEAVQLQNIDLLVLNNLAEELKGASNKM